MNKIKSMVYGLMLLCASSCNNDNNNKYLLNERNSRLGREMPKLSLFEDNDNLVKEQDLDQPGIFRGMELKLASYADIKSDVYYSALYDKKTSEVVEATMYVGDNIFVVYGSKFLNKEGNRIEKMQKLTETLDRTIYDSKKGYGFEDGKISMLLDNRAFDNSSSVKVFYDVRENIEKIIQKGLDVNSIVKLTEDYDSQTIYVRFFNVDN